ncbi:coagulation factor XIII A chain-like [Eucyclogobius newberryi]|uniref:coagulation factor XIII A chain-like n=1 Tax=Eucyclogobius newberryi TaxID=166745 RepID=UPI003B5B4B92
MSRHRYNVGRFNQQEDLINLFEDKDSLPQFEPFNDGDATPRGAPGSPLVVEDIDLCKSMNSGPHKTTMYNTEALVIRRGFPVVLKVTFNRPITAQDDFQLQFRIGANPNPLRQSLVSVRFSGLVPSGPWEASASEQQGALVIQVTPAVDAVIGKYRVVVGVALANGLQFSSPEPKHELYLLFNAFNPRDAAFLGAEHEGYILSDSGVIYIGDVANVHPRPWHYGQFEKDVLEACIFIMDRSQLPISNRGDAVKVIRMASAMINSQDDNGVLVGNWSEDFSLGKSPMHWTGSVQILQEYLHTATPVSFAQCWVYAGVLNTFLRCLGLAARVVSNFSSAHDNDGNLKMDLIFNASDMTLDTRHTRDSIWNYHCWNEVHLKRSDVPEEFSGWQVVDSTPQETSDGNYRCGPASVKAIKMGKVCFPFDGRFIFAEVNSDVLYYSRDKYGNLKLEHIDKTKVGKKLMTQSPHNGQGLDITLDYKHDEYSPDGQQKNEEALATAESFGCSREHTQLPPATVSIKINTKKAFVGSPVEAQVDFVNQSDAPLQSRVLVTVETIYYTGVSSRQVHQETYNLDLPPKSSQQMEVTVPSHDYMRFLSSQPNLKLTVTAKLPQGGIVSESAVISLEVLWLQLRVSSPVYVGQRTMASVSFNNKLDVALVQPNLAMEGPGLLSYKSKDFENIEPGASLKWDVEFYAYSVGTKTLSALLVSKNQYMAWGFIDVNVLPAPHWLPPTFGSAPFGYPTLGSFGRSLGGA